MFTQTTKTETQQVALSIRARNKIVSLDNYVTVEKNKDKENMGGGYIEIAYHSGAKARLVFETEKDMDCTWDDIAEILGFKY